jgi:cytochrome c oxidase assembly protein subunit 20
MEESKESDLDKVLSSLTFTDFINVGTMPCAKKSMSAGLALGVPVALIRYFSTRKWRSAGNWGFMTWAFTGSISYQYCIYQRRVVLQEFEKMAQSVNQVG